MIHTDIQALIQKLNLIPHEREGGYYYESYRSDEIIPHTALPARYAGPRCYGTAIYYMLTPGTLSALHKLESDEIFHFYLGDPVEMLNLHPDGSGNIIRFGQDIFNGYTLQHTVPKGSWQGCRLAEGGKFALFGVTVSPGFEFADYTHAERAGLVRQYPDFKEEIARLSV